MSSVTLGTPRPVAGFHRSAEEYGARVPGRPWCPSNPGSTYSRSRFLAAGVAPRQVTIILEQRPFADMVAFAATPFIGEKTVEAARRGGGG